MRVKRCTVCGGEFTPTSIAGALTQTKCSPCWARYQRELAANPKLPSPCLGCGGDTMDHRASVKYCPDCRFKVREKKCVSCGAAWMPNSWSEFQSRSRCRPCFYKVRNGYRHAAYHGLRKPLPCRECGKSTGDVRQSVVYCKDHGYIGRWWSMWKRREGRRADEYRARVEELERLKPYLEEKKWLALAKKELARVKSALRERTRAQRQSPTEGSRPPATSPG